MGNTMAYSECGNKKCNNVFEQTKKTCPYSDTCPDFIYGCEEEIEPNCYVLEDCVKTRPIDANALKDVLSEYLVMGINPLLRFIDEQPTISPDEELPEHGDLISRDEALSFPWANGKYDHKNANEHFIYGLETYREWLEQLPVVIPSNKEE